MKGVITTQLPGGMVAPAPNVPREQRPLRNWLRRRAADVWLNLLFWSARRHPVFARGSKPLWMWGAWRCSPMLRNNTLANARRLLGEDSTTAQREALGRAVIGHFYDFVCDVGRSIGASRQELLARIERIEGHETYMAARQAGKGAIVVTAHMGSFEVGMAALLEHEKRIHVLFRRDALGLFERTRSALRKQLGIVEACVDDGLSAWVGLREALAANEVVLIQGDRVMPGQKGQRLPFLGGHMLVPTGPVKLAMATGAPIIPIFSIRQPDGRIRLFVEPPIDLDGGAGPDQNLRRVTSVIERYVRRYPEQWLMVHRAWCEDVECSAGTTP